MSYFLKFIQNLKLNLVLLAKTICLGFDSFNFPVTFILIINHLYIF